MRVTVPGGSSSPVSAASSPDPRRRRRRRRRRLPSAVSGSSSSAVFVGLVVRVRLGLESVSESVSSDSSPPRPRPRPRRPRRRRRLLPSSASSPASPASSAAGVVLDVLVGRLFCGRVRLRLRGGLLGPPASPSPRRWGLGGGVRRGLVGGPHGRLEERRGGHEHRREHGGPLGCGRRLLGRRSRVGVAVIRAGHQRADDLLDDLALDRGLHAARLVAKAAEGSEHLAARDPDQLGERVHAHLLGQVGKIGQGNGPAGASGRRIVLRHVAPSPPGAREGRPRRGTCSYFRVARCATGNPGRDGSCSTAPPTARQVRVVTRSGPSGSAR